MNFGEVTSGLLVAAIVGATALAYHKPEEYMVILRLIGLAVIPAYAAGTVWIAAYATGARHAFEASGVDLSETDFNFNYPFSGLSDPWLWSPAIVFFAGIALVRLMLHMRS